MSVVGEAVAGAAAGAAAGAVVTTGCNLLIQPLIDRRKQGRQLARSRLGVYIPGSGRMMEFTSTTTNTKSLTPFLKKDGWLKEYLNQPVIDLSELASALQAVNQLPQRTVANVDIEDTVMVLGTIDPVKKLEGILVAFKKGFLDKTGPAARRVPWKLLHDAELPGDWSLDNYQLLDIWFALHCEFIFPIDDEKVIAAANTYHRICKWPREPNRSPPPTVFLYHGTSSSQWNDSSVLSKQTRFT